MKGIIQFSNDLNVESLIKTFKVFGRNHSINAPIIVCVCRKSSVSISTRKDDFAYVSKTVSATGTSITGA